MLVVQSAVVYTAPVLLLALLFEPEALPIDLTIGIAGAFFDPAAYGGWSPGLVATLGLLTALIGSGVAVVGVRRIPALIDRIPSVVSSGFVGARSLLAMAVPGVGGVVIVGVCVEVLTDGLGWALGAAYLLTVCLLPGCGVDSMWALPSWCSRCASSSGTTTCCLRDRPDVVVRLRGGDRCGVSRGVAARRPGSTGSAPRAETVLVGATAGGIAAIGLLIGATLTTGAAGSLAGPAFGLGLLWSAVAVLGALSVSPGRIGGSQRRLPRRQRRPLWPRRRGPIRLDARSANIAAGGASGRNPISDRRHCGAGGRRNRRGRGRGQGSPRRCPAAAAAAPPPAA